VILVEDYAAGDKQSFLDIGAVVEGPEGESHEVRLKQVGPNRYEGHFPLSGQGRYKVKSAAAGSDDIIHGAFVVPYSQEYLRFRANPIVLNEIAERTAGRELNVRMTGDEVYNLDRQPKVSTRPIVDLLLVIMACVLVLDVGLRRVQLDWDVIRGWLRPTRVSETSDAMLGALKARKKDVSATLRDKRDEDEPASWLEPQPAATKPARPMSLIEKARARQAQEQQRAKEKDKQADGTMTNRLLAAKKRTRDRE
jgi:hypothetical protein